LSYTYKKERSVAFKIRQNPFRAGAPPRTLLGELTMLPQTHSRLGRGHPPQTPPHSAPTHLRRSIAMRLRSPRIPARSMSMLGGLAIQQQHSVEVLENSHSLAFPSNNSYSHSRGLYHSHGLPMSRMRVGYSHSSCRHLVADCARFITKPFARLSVLE